MKKMDFLIEFIVTTVLVGFIFAASLTFKVPDSPLIVQGGEDAVLLCLLPPDTNAEEMEVRWYRELESLVHSYMIHRDVIEAQSEQYRGRTSLSREELKKGNVSLQLRDVRSSDEGSYSCCVLSAGMQCAAEIQLKVVDSSFSVEVPMALVSARVGDTVTLPCRLSPLSSAVLMEVRWFREGVKAPVYFYTLQKAMTSVQSEEYRDRTRLFMEELRNGNLSLQLDNTQTSDSGLYKCSVSYNLKEAEAVVELKVAGDTDDTVVSTESRDSSNLPSKTSLTTYAAILLTIALLIIGLLVIFSCKKHVKASVQNEKQPLNEGCESCKKLDSELQRYKENAGKIKKHLPLQEASGQMDKELANNDSEIERFKEECKELRENFNAEGYVLNSDWAKIHRTAVEVTLPPDPANRNLRVSKNRLITFVGEESAEWPSVRGNEGFTSGRHYWEVKVGERGYWALGVSTHPDEKNIPEKPEEGYWLLRLGGGKYEAVSQSIVTIALPGKKKLEKVGVCLDYDEKKIAFYNVFNAKTRFHIHTIEGGLSGQVYPIFSPGSHDGDPLIIVSVKHHNK